MSKGYFITGTDTGVGKTFISAGLGAAAREMGLDVGMFKPISCGGTEDAMIFKKRVGLADPLDLINPVRFRQPLSPFAASKSEKVRIDIKKLKRDFDLLKGHRDFVLVEGIGGALCPIRKDYFVADMIRSFAIPSVIVARAGLGTINHTLMTVEALKARKVEIAGIIMNGFDDGELSQRSNAGVIEGISGAPVIGRIRAKSSFASLIEQIKKQRILERLA